MQAFFISYRKGGAGERFFLKRIQKSGIITFTFGAACIWCAVSMSAAFLLFPLSLPCARKKKDYMGPLSLLILLILICLIGFSLLAVLLKTNRPNERHKRPTQALHDVIFGQDDE
jgi:hypothetical protein